MRKSIYISFCGVILGAALLLPRLAVAEEAIGSVVVSRGSVSAIAKASERDLGVGDEFFLNERITTGDKSFAILQFVDGAKVTVRPASELVVEQYAYMSGDEDEATLNLVSGGLRIITGAVAKSDPENYKVRTPMALMGVRGTEFVVQLCGQELCDEYQTGLVE